MNVLWSQTDAKALPGSGSLRLSTGSTSAHELLGAEMCTGVSPGGIYAFGGSVLIPKENTDDPTAEVNLRLTYRDAGLSPLLVTGIDFREPELWRTEAIQSTSPASAAFACVSVLLTNPNTAGPVAAYVDDLFLGSTPTMRTLNVVVDGAGSGMVTSNPVGIVCGAGNALCSASFSTGSVVTLTAGALTGSVFAGWGSGSMETTAVVRLDADATQTATFATCLPPDPPSWLVPVNGATNVSLNPTYSWMAASGATEYALYLDNVYRGTFAGTSATSQTLGYGETHTWYVAAVSSCGVTASAPATFTTLPPACCSLSIAKSGSGGGTVTAAWGTERRDCETQNCTWTVPSGSQVTLTQSPLPHSYFTGWSYGGCPGSTCTVNVTGSVSVAPGFDVRRNSNDACGTATPMAAFPFTDSAWVADATRNGTDPAPPCNGLALERTSWYTVTPRSAGTLTVDTFGSGFDTVLSAWSGSCGAPVAVPGSCADDTGGRSQSRIAFPVSAGTKYWVMASTRSTSGGGHLVVNAAFAPTFGPCPSPTFSGPQTVASGSGLGQPIIADVNRDGHLDLVVPDGISSRLDLFLGTGSGTFGSPGFLALGSTPNAVMAGDLNDDGWTDLAAATSAGTFVFLANGSGGFVAPVSYPVSGAHIARADLDGDGILDILVSSSLAVSVLHGTGAGVFETGPSLFTGTQPGAIFATDLNGDGIPDVAVVDQATSWVGVSLGTGTLSFGTPTFFPAGPGALGLAAGDLDLDGDADIAVSCNSGRSIAVLLGNGRGSFATGAPVQTAGAWPGSVSLVDVTGDGKLDIVAGRTDGSDLSVFAGRGDGTFDPPSSVPIGLTAVPSVVVGDFDENGKPDVAATNPMQGSLGLVLNSCVQATPLAVTRVVGGPGPTTGGTSITILGTGFVSGATVAVGGAAATDVVVMGSTTIAAVTPPHAAGPVSVTVTNPGGGNATLGSAFIYCAPPTATVSGTATVCEGSSATLQAVLTGTAPWSIVWSDGYQQTGIQTSPATRAVFARAGEPVTYTVTSVADGSGCPGGRSSGSAVVTTTAASGEITAPSGACPGARGLTASVSDAGAGATYTWAVSNGTLVSGAGTRSITFDVGAAGFTTLDVTVTGATGCRATGRRAVTLREPRTWQGGGPDGGLVQLLAMNPTWEDSLIATTFGGIPFATDTAGREWTKLRVPGSEAMVETVAVDPRSRSRILAARATNIYRSTNGGATWAGPASWGASPIWLNALLVMPSGPDVIWAATNDGLFKSTDGALSFARVGFQGIALTSLAAGGTTGQVLYMGSLTRGVDRSTDSGATWSFSGLGAGNVYRIWTARSTSAVAYAQNAAGYYRTTDTGASWTPLGSLPGGAAIATIGVHPLVPQSVFAGTGDGRVFSSADYGQTWTQPPSSGLAVSDVRRLAVTSSTPPALYAGTNDGVYQSPDGGATWARSAFMLRGSSVMSLAVDAGSRKDIYAWEYFGGPFRSADAGESWVAAGRGIADGGQGNFGLLLADPVTAGRIYAAVRGDGLYRSDDNAQSWSKLSPDVWSFSGYSDFAVSSADPQRVYLGHWGDGVSASTDGGRTWQARTAGLTDLFVRHLALHPAAADTVLAATDSAGVFSTTDGGLSWSPSSSGLSDLAARFIVIDASSPTRVYVSTASGLFRSTNGGATWVQSNYAPNLDAIALNPAAPATVYVADMQTPGRVYKSTDAGSTWIDSWQVPCRVVRLAVVPGTPETLLAATEGCGVLTYTEVPIPSIATVAPPEGWAMGGDAVTITGSSFDAGARVFFGDTPAASVTVVDSSTITVSSPAHLEGSVDVTVTNPGCGTATMTGAFMYVAARDNLRVGRVAARPGDTVKIPVFVSDYHGTPLGADRGAGMRVQGLSLRAVASQPQSVVSLGLGASGATAGLTPLFSQSSEFANTAAWVARFSETSSPLRLQDSPLYPGDEVAALTVSTSPSAAPGTGVSIALDPAYTLLSNDSGLTAETSTSGHLSLSSGGVQFVYPSDVELSNGVPRPDSITGTVPQGSWRFFYANLPAKARKATVTLTSLSGDVDLYILRDVKPDAVNYSCRSAQTGTLPEACAYSGFSARVLWVGVNNVGTGPIAFTVTADWGSSFYTVAPCRVVDTRNMFGSLGGPALPAGGTRVFPFAASACGIPANAKAVSANVTVTQPAALGSLTLFPGDESLPLASTINFRAAQTRANNAILKLSANGTGTINVANSSTGTVHLIVDVNGFFE